jgi:BMFP domain-containing protein YqiC
MDSTKLLAFVVHHLEFAVIAVSAIDDLARRLIDFIPPDFKDVRADLSTNFKDTLRSGLHRLDLVTREEFDVQRCVLLRTRELVEALESRVAELEALLSGKTTAH